EEGQRGEDPALLRDRVRQDDVEGRDPVGGDDEERVPVHGVHGADLPAAQELDVRKRGLDDGGHAVTWTPRTRPSPGERGPGRRGGRPSSWPWSWPPSRALGGPAA